MQEYIKKILGSRHRPLNNNNNTIIIISNDEMKGFIRMVKSLEDSGLLFEGVSETIHNKAKNKEEDFLVCY